MSDWTPLTTEPFITEDGSMVTVISSKAEMIDMGNALQNGLGDRLMPREAEAMRDIYASLGAQGRFQCIMVNDPMGEVVATGRLYVENAETDPKVALRFLRGFRNVDIAGDEPPAAVVAEYLQALNANTLENTGFGFDGFTHVPLVVAPVAAVAAAVEFATPMQKAIEAARLYNEGQDDPARHITPIQALAKGLGKITPAPFAAQDATPVQAVEDNWLVPTVQRDYADGVSLRFVRNIGELARFAGDLENPIFMPGQTEQVAELIKKGERIVAGVFVNGSIQGLASFVPQNSMVALRVLDGYGFDKITTGPMARAAQAFSRDMTFGFDGQEMFPVGNTFENTPADELVLVQGAVPEPYLIPAQRNVGGGDGGGYGGYDGGYDAGEDGDAPALGESEVESWSGVYGDYTAGNGVQVCILTTKEAIQNALEDLQLDDEVTYGDVDDLVTSAQAGDLQYYSVVKNGDIIGFGALMVEDGGIAFNGEKDGNIVALVGYDDGVGPVSANIAVSQFTSDMNRGKILPLIAVKDSGFDVTPTLDNAPGI